MDDWLHHVDHEEDRDAGEHESHEVSREPNVDDSVSFERGKGLIVAMTAGFSGEGDILPSETLDVQVDLDFELGLCFEVLDHLHDQALLLVERGEV
jgi:hypothetical protein